MWMVVCTTIGPYIALVFDGPLPFTEWRAIVVDDGRYNTLPVHGCRRRLPGYNRSADMTGKDALFAE